MKCSFRLDPECLILLLLAFLSALCPYSPADASVDFQVNGSKYIFLLHFELVAAAQYVYIVSCVSSSHIGITYKIEVPNP
jgi:hypothetical protein